MNRKLSAVLFFFLIAQTIQASEIKAMVGMNSSNYIFSAELESFDHQQKMSFNFGIGWAFNLNPNIKLEINALYSHQKTKAAITYTPDKTVSGFYRNTAIDFPILFKYKFKDKASPYVSLGPEFDFIVAHSLEIPESEEKFDLIDNTRKFVLAFNVLFGYEWPFGQWGLFAEIRYNRRLGNLLIDPETSVKSKSFIFLLGGVYYL